MLILSIIGLVIATLGTIFYQFPFVPKNISFDELEFARLAISLIKHPSIYSTLATGHTTPYYYFILGAFKLFGISAFSLRLPSALFGLANVFLVYSLLTKFFSQKTSFFGAFLFATSRWVFQFARFSFEGTYLLFWELSAILFVLEYIKNHRLRYLIGTIVTTVLTFYSYLPGRIFFIVPLYLIFREKKLKHQGIIFLIIFALCAIPLLLITNTLESRVSSLTYVTNSTIPFLTKVSFFFENIWKTVSMFAFTGDLNGRHNFPVKPALNPFITLLFFIGIIKGIHKGFLEEKKYILFYIWFLVSLLPSFFVYPNENPHFLRTYTATVSTIFFCTLTVDYIFTLKKNSIAALLIICILLSSIHDVRTYFKYQTSVFKKAFEVKTMELGKLKF